ncbi:MAG TPA: glycosyltransferase [Acidobacteriaceae bacterium]|jgi:glycosyltransferase involved in cell wall biosynthesis|nr:glycosyltransferase [Acidobacteriaceae bacterium]
MTHLAMILPSLDAIGGAERQAVLLAKALAARGMQVTVICLAGEPNATTRDLDASRVGWLSLGMRKAWIDPRGWSRYLEWQTANSPQIVHTHLPHATWFARCIRLFSPVRVQIDTIHTTHAGGAARRLTYRLTHRLTSRVTCVSAAVLKSAISDRLAPEKDLEVVPNGVALAPVSGSPTAPVSFLWLAVGRLAPVKDYPTLLRAFARLPAEPRLTIAGSGPGEQSLRHLAAELGVASRVHFAGFQPDIQPFLLAADAFVLSSLWEGLPVSVLEASAAALPCVVTDGAGTREAILPSETGFLTPVGDPVALAAAMSEIMTMTPWQRREMGLRARQFVEERYSLPAIADRWQELYSRLLTKHPQPSRMG